MSFYLDTNVIVSIFRADSGTARSVRWLGNVSAPFHVSDFAAIEFASVLSRDVRTATMEERTAQGIIDKFDTWRQRSTRALAVGSRDMLLAETFARDFRTKLLAPDALHLAMAMNAGLTLVTLDQRLADAARMKGVPVMVPS